MGQLDNDLCAQGTNDDVDSKLNGSAQAMEKAAAKF